MFIKTRLGTECKRFDFSTLYKLPGILYYTILIQNEVTQSSVPAKQQKHKHQHPQNKNWDIQAQASRALLGGHCMLVE